MNSIQDKIELIKRHLNGLEAAYLEEDQKNIKSEWSMIHEKMGELKKLLKL